MFGCRLFHLTVTSHIGRYSRQLSYSRMLDMGGAPSSGSDQSLIRTVNASKNSRLQAVAFDFQTLINVTDNTKKNNDNAALDHVSEGISTAQAVQENRVSSSAAIADADRVQQVASLLKIDLGSSPNSTESGKIDVATEPSRSMRQSKLEDHNPNDHDIRAKYASKIKGKLAGIQLAKSAEDTLINGDAAVHLAARKIAASIIPNGKNNGAKRWLPSQTASELLTLLTQRSIRIILLPPLGTVSEKLAEGEEEPSMEDFKSQLKNVIIDNIIPKFEGSSGDERIEDALRIGVLDELSIDASKILLVSKRDAYLRVARNMGMNICRLQPKNARRGSITAHYTVESMEQLQDIVNEINGISFNFVLKR